MLAVAGELPKDLALHLEQGMAFTKGKGGFTCPRWSLMEQLHKLVRGTG